MVLFWSVEDLGELADGPSGCGEVASGECLFVWKFSVTSSTVLTEREDSRPNMPLSLR